MSALFLKEANIQSAQYYGYNNHDLLYQTVNKQMISYVISLQEQVLVVVAIQAYIKVVFVLPIQNFTGPYFEILCGDLPLIL